MWWWFMLVISVGAQISSAQLLRFQERVMYYQIAGVFEKSADTQKLAFNDSMHSIKGAMHKMQTVIIEPQRSDSYTMWRDLCSKSIKPIVVVGPQSSIADGAVQDQCARAHVPHIQATWQPLDPDIEPPETVTDDDNDEDEDDDDDEEEDEVIEPTFKKISINFYPDSDGLSIALAKLLKFYKWESFSILYEDDFGLIRIQKILAEYSEKFPINVRRLDPFGSNKMIFKELYNFQESRILLDCHADRIMKYMEDASVLYRNTTMVSYYQHYIFTSMDAATIQDQLIKFECNSTWLSLPKYNDLLHSPLNSRLQRWKNSDLESPKTAANYEIEALLMEDIANHIAKALGNMQRKIHKPKNALCEADGSSIPWADGIAFQDQLLKETSMGVTGHIQFDDRGRRVNYTLYVNEIHLKERRMVGTWNSVVDSEIVESEDSIEETVKNKKLKKNFLVISKRVQPYFDFKQKCEGPDCEEDPNPEINFEGFCVDLVAAIFQYLQSEGFNYTYQFKHEKDQEYGKYDEKEKKWVGLIGDLLNKEADLAIGDFTITEERKKVIDFSVPFMTLGISILYVQDHKVPPNFFSFLNPYEFEVWMYIATAYCVVSIALYICARISPADWENPEPCDKEPECLENIWTFKNCLWLTMGSIMTQGCDILPKAFGTRWVCGMWWFFAVIVCQTYIAQLSASMTSALEQEPLNSVEDLAKQNKILYGAYRSGTTLEFFMNSKDKMYRQIYENMAAHEAVLTGGNEEGMKRVLQRKGKYAFFMESSTIEYKLKRNCNLKKVGPELDSKDYGIAMPANSPFRSDINRAILKLKEQTQLEEIKKKWWEKKYGAKECPSLIVANDVEGDLEMENLKGAFAVLVGGLVLAVLITAIEFANEVRNIVIREQVTHKEVYIKELKASLNFFQLQKPVLRNPSRAPSVDMDRLEVPDKTDKLSGIQNFLEFEKEIM